MHHGWGDAYAFPVLGLKLGETAENIMINCYLLRIQQPRTLTQACLPHCHSQSVIDRHQPTKKTSLCKNTLHNTSCYEKL